MDTEGFDGTGQADVYDDRIASFAALISSVMVYNLAETIKQADIERLAFAAQLSREFWRRAHRPAQQRDEQEVEDSPGQQEAEPRAEIGLGAQHEDQRAKMRRGHRHQPPDADRGQTTGQRGNRGVLLRRGRHGRDAIQPGAMQLP